MEALGVTMNNGMLYWNGRYMTYEVICEFIAVTETQAAFPFLAQARALDLMAFDTNYETDEEDDQFDITIDFEDANCIVHISYRMDNINGEYFTIYINDEYVEDGDDINRLPSIRPYLSRLAESAANKRRVVELTAENKNMADKIVELEAENAALRAEITERRLRPGGEDYEIARERFETQAYE